MNIWRLNTRFSRVNKIYILMFVLGLIILFLQWKNYTFEVFELGSPIAFIIAGSYFWIRLDIWRTDETIDDLCNSGGVCNKSCMQDLFSRRFDSRALILLLAVATIVQVWSLWRKNGGLIFLGLLFVLIPLVNFIVRRLDKIQLTKFQNKKVK